MHIVSLHQRKGCFLLPLFDSIFLKFFPNLGEGVAGRQSSELFLNKLTYVFLSVFSLIVSALLYMYEKYNVINMVSS